MRPVRSIVDDLYAQLYGAALMPLWENVVRRRPTLALLAQLENAQWQKPDELAALQFLYLKALLERAGERVPYYRELFAKIGFVPAAMRSRAELLRIPPLTKEIIRARYQDLVDPSTVGKNIVKGTSGSTGQPLKFEYSLESESWRQATRIRGYRWSGWAPGLPTFFYWGPGPRTRKITIDRALRREVYVDSLRSSDTAMLEDIETFRRMQPRVLICYVQTCAQWARFIVERGLRDWPDVSVICGAEAVLPADRAALTRAFGPNIFETYGSRETMMISAECDAHDGMHLSEENLLTETVDDSGQPVGPGNPGDVLVTDLHNHGMPLIRYANGDVGVLSNNELCRCGRGLAKLMRVEGRRTDTLVDSQGQTVSGIFVHVLFADARNDIVKQFQATQRLDGHVHLRVVRGPDFTDEAFAKALGRFDTYLRGVPVTVEFCEKIAPQPNGKFKSIVRQTV